MKKKLNKYDFLAINRRMNNNFNGGYSYFTGNAKKLDKGEEMKLNRKEKEKRK